MKIKRVQKLVEEAVKVNNTPNIEEIANASRPCWCLEFIGAQSGLFFDNEEEARAAFKDLNVPEDIPEKTGDVVLWYLNPDKNDYDKDIVLDYIRNPLGKSEEELRMLGITEKLNEKIAMKEAEGDQPLDIEDASVKDVTTDIIQGAEEAGVPVNPEAAAEEAQKVLDIADAVDFDLNPYAKMTAKPNLVTRALQRSLTTAIRNRLSGLGRKDYPNIIIYGLAGFGKTSIVQSFCDAHKNAAGDAGLHLFPCDAKTLDSATVGGIPYPKKNDETGETTQSPIASDYWKNLELPNTILFLDELNRANARVRGTLLTLINEHKLPAYIEDPETGKVKNEKFYENILFTVIAINPASDVFEGANPLDPAEVSRVVASIEQKPDIRDFLNLLDGIYGSIKNLTTLHPNIKMAYAGQYDIARAILTDRSFSFDNADDVKAIYKRQRQGQVGNYLNYRTFFGILLNCDGTKNDYFDALEISGIQESKVQLIKNILATYTDKQTVGNQIFDTTASASRVRTTQLDVESALADFEASLK